MIGFLFKVSGGTDKKVGFLDRYRKGDEPVYGGVPAVGALFIWNMVM